MLFLFWFIEIVSYLLVNLNNNVRSFSYTIDYWYHFII